MGKSCKRAPDWSPEEDATLRRLWRELVPLKKIVEMLPGRTISSVAKRRQTLNLPLRSGPRADPTANPVMQKIWRTLKKRRATRAQLAARAKVAPSTVSKFVQLFRPRIHICGWVKADSGEPAQIFKAGVGDDVPKPTALTTSEKARRWWERCKRDRPIYAGRRIARDSQRRRDREGKSVRRDVAAIALFGESGCADQ